MNCEAWGPSGWKFLHSIALHYDLMETMSSPNNIKRFFKSIQHILPCIYCRRSYAQYIKELPIEPFIKKHRVSEWIYHIHNKVNAKLRGQGYLISKDPSYQKAMSNVIRCYIGWDFIYCIAFNYPVLKEDISNVRYHGHITFFNTLPSLLYNKKYDKCKDFFIKYPIEESLSSREDFTKWVYALENFIKNGKCCTYDKKCKKIEKHRVEKCDGGTCRK